MEIKISILMAVYNAELFLSEAINSVIQQNYKFWELICVDDGSTDDSLTILKNFANRDSRIKVLTQANAGAANARNAALGKSIGEYICILDADDKLSSDYLEQTLLVALQNVENDCVIPELYIWNWKEEEKSYSCNNIFVVPENCNGQDAFELSIPWRIHALALWRGDLIRNIGYRIDGYITSDEVSSRDFFISCRKVVSSAGRYYYRYNLDSITKAHSFRLIEKLLTNIQLNDLAVSNGMSEKNIRRIRTAFFEELISITIYYFKNRHLFSFEERQISQNIINKAYKLRNIASVESCGFKSVLKKYILGYNYCLFKSVCYSVYLIRK